MDLTTVPTNRLRAWQYGAWATNALDDLERFTAELRRRDNTEETA